MEVIIEGRRRVSQAEITTEGAIEYKRVCECPLRFLGHDRHFLLFHPPTQLGAGLERPPHFLPPFRQHRRQELVESWRPFARTLSRLPLQVQILRCYSRRRDTKWTEADHAHQRRGSHCCRREASSDDVVDRVSTKYRWRTNFQGR